MKKFIIAMLCTGIAAAASAQKNSILLFGNLEGGSGTTNTQNSKEVQNSFNITPGVGYQVSDKWTLGVEASVNYNADNNSSTPASYSNKAYGISGGGGLFARLTLPITTLLYFYTQADAAYTTGKSYTNGVEDEGSAFNNFYVTLSPAIGINIKNGYGLNFGFGSIGYYYRNTPSDKTTTSSINYSFGHAFTIGMSKNFIHHIKKPVAKPIEEMGAGDE